MVGLLLLWGAGSWGRQSDLLVRRGEPFPDLAFEGLLSEEAYGALGLAGRRGRFRLSEVPGNLLVLEFFNRYCLTCWREAPQLDAFAKLLAPGDLGGQVRILSVGSGNSAEELRAFVAENRVSYPVAADPNFDLYRRLGDPGGTPFTIFLQRVQGGWVLADYHLGFFGDVELLARSRVLLKGVELPPPSDGGVGRQQAAADVGDPRVEGLLSRVMGSPARVEALDLPGPLRIYRAVGADGAPTGLYARIATRSPVCDLCHPIWFLFAFDEDGVVRGFEPIYVTKFGNEVWGEDDNAKLRSRLTGRKMEEMAFWPEVDSVTSATMSSALIYDEVRRTAYVLPLLQRSGETRQKQRWSRPEAR